MPDPDAMEPMAAAPTDVAAVILAAGRSRRMGTTNKLQSDVSGRPMLARVADAALSSPARPVVVVTGHDADAVRATLEGRAVRFVHNGRYAEGMGSSLAAGIRALGPGLAGALICLGDMPWLPICVPVHAGQRGHPVLFAARYFPELEELRGDSGARQLLAQHADQVCAVPVNDPGVILDVDTPESLRRGASSSD
jgi:molybdenum cofactor cytidylyltransferase